MLQLITLQGSGIKFYRTIHTELRAWVENPLFKKEPGQPVYLLCKVIKANGAEKLAHVEEIGGEGWQFYSCPFTLIHCVHDYAPELNKVMRVYGEPQ